MDLKLPLAAVLITGAAAGLLLPELGSMAPQDEPRLLDARQASPASANGTDSAWAQDVVLAREADGHFYADVTVDGQSLRMLVDTGASVVALTGSDAEALGLTWDEADVTPVAQGASGPVLGVNVTIPELALGDHVAENVQALIIPEGLVVSLLGQSFLSTLGQVRMDGDQMIVGNGDG
ncbi:retropepsin-like aspartic protease family protein [Alteraurantiacibacter buctensis]|uniref:TIGR02281 family clan AA aspartic protease n=1 Tax=Alteraurantiacibacter buctensis TaxID=1503981 RepID=A0A844Z3W7_9SPHN|nr:TIGR02281 family clan AA aspartic protease [Alteraurantiacibacter buctensis]MXO73374.1 TIGR02281 family clan AA aspartic protease [Alteraurantiacibacter buctensis]